MKNLKAITIYTTLFVMSVGACNEDTIDLEPVGDTEAAFFQNEAQMTQAVFGIYAKLTWFYNRGPSGDNTLQSIWLLPSDDLTTTGNHATEIFASLSGSDGKMSRYFNLTYQLINRANTVLQKIEENGTFAYPEDSNLDDYHRGEALFLRSLMYFNMWNIFGTAPLVTQRIVALDDTAYPPNSSGTQLLDQAIIDLTEAATLLPEQWDAGNLGRATRNSARGLLAKSLLFRGTVNNSTADFTAAIAAVDAITGADLAPNFNDNFDAAKENNIESLFEFQANRALADTNPWVPGGNDEFSVIGELCSFWGFFNNQGVDAATNTFRATESLQESFEDGDPRIGYSFNPAVAPEDGHNVVKYILKNVTTPDNAWLGLSQNNARILRYADALLIKAEAIARSGGSLASVAEIINRIRERARNSVSPAATAPVDIATPADADEALEAIFLERRLELAFEEGHRWFDLRRRHLAGEIDLTAWDFGSIRGDFAFEEFNINFPLPESEVVLSPNLDQNEGY